MRHMVLYSQTHLLIFNSQYFQSGDCLLKVSFQTCLLHQVLSVLLSHFVTFVFYQLTLFWLGGKFLREEWANWARGALYLVIVGGLDSFGQALTNCNSFGLIRRVSGVSRVARRWKRDIGPRHFQYFFILSLGKFEFQFPATTRIRCARLNRYRFLLSKDFADFADFADFELLAERGEGVAVFFD